MSYQCVMSNGHYLAVIGQRIYVIDTGSPVSFSYCGDKSIEIDGINYPLSAMQLAEQRATEKLVQHHVDGFIGLDLLYGTGYLFIDRESERIAFSKIDPVGDTGHVLLFRRAEIFHISRLLIDVLVKGETEGEAVTCVLDTGARISYLEEELIAHLPVTGHVSDTAPGLGSVIEEDEKRPRIVFGEMEQEWPVARLPMLASLEIGFFGAGGILGISPLFNKKILFDFTENKIYTDK